MAKKLKWNLILMSLLYLALGIFLLMVPGTALNVVCYALGGVVLACAAVQLVRYFVVERGVFQSQLTLISGLVCLALGAFLIIRSDIVVRVLPIVFGLFIIFDSLGRVQNALELRRCEYSSWKVFLLLAVLSVILGIVMVVDPFGTMETLVMAIGLILILEAALNLLSALYTMLAVRRFMKLHPETQSMLEAVTGKDLNGDGVWNAFDLCIMKQKYINKQNEGRPVIEGEAGVITEHKITFKSGIGSELILEVEKKDCVGGGGCISFIENIDDNEYWIAYEWQTNDSGVVKIDMTKPNQITLNDVKVEQNGNEELYKRLTEQCMNEKEANLFYWWVAESWGNNLPEGTDLTKYIKVRSVHITSPIN